jgi:hypothetical protein
MTNLSGTLRTAFAQCALHHENGSITHGAPLSMGMDVHPDRPVEHSSAPVLDLGMKGPGL